MYTAREFGKALRRIPKPGRRQLAFLQVHYDAPGRAVTTDGLAAAVGYRSYRGINLRYGLLAVRIAATLNVPVPDPRILLLVEFARPHTITNDQYVIVMRPEFADALAECGWVRPRKTSRNFVSGKS